MSKASTRTEFVRSLIEDKFDPQLGQKVYSHLGSKGLETLEQADYQPEAAFVALEEGVRQAFQYLGLDPSDPSTKETPSRFAKMFIGELTRGLNYDLFPKCTTTPNGVTTEDPQGHYSLGYDGPRPITHTSKGAYNQMVLVRDIQTMSLCEHHLQTIDGVTHIAYIPASKVLGLSKFARVTDFFARRPQIQERMTEQIYEALTVILETKDIAVIQDATHYCMKARGALQSNARTQTDKMGGKFFSEASLRGELFNAIRST